tara:strand:+ start:130 stop:402 length:273 start_codon:yes stop_codon:yes gene_type:complete
MELIKKIIELIVALSKLGWAHIVDLFPRKAQKFFDDLEKKPINSQPKISVSEYISIESDKFLDEREESRQREHIIQKYFNYDDDEPPTFI